MSGSPDEHDIKIAEDGGVDMRRQLIRMPVPGVHTPNGSALLPSSSLLDALPAFAKAEFEAPRWKPVRRALGAHSLEDITQPVAPRKLWKWLGIVGLHTSPAIVYLLGSLL